MKFSAIKCSALILLSALALAACGSTEEANDETVKIGVIQYAEHEALDAAYQGFVAALAEAGYEEGDRLSLNLQNAQGDQANLQTMVEQLAGENDVNFAIATPAAQALLNADSTTPAVFTAVTDPVAANLVDSMANPGGSMTGSVDANDVTGQIEMLLKVVPEAKKVGIFYNSSEVNSEAQAAKAKKALAAAGVDAVIKTVTTTNDVQDVLTSLASQVDALYFPTDNTVASTVSTIGEVLTAAKVPAMGSDEAVLEGVLFTYGVDYHAIGVQAGEMAVQILEGADPAELSVATPDTAAVAINKDMAEAVGIAVSDIEALNK